MDRFYLMPGQGTGKPMVDPFCPKYIRKRGWCWNSRSYGGEHVYLVSMDLGAEDHASIMSHGDVLAFPSDLSRKVGDFYLKVQKDLFTRHIPARWVTSRMTFLEVLARVENIFDFAQRFHGLTHQSHLLHGRLNLNATLSLIPTYRAAFMRAALSFGSWDMGFMRKDTNIGIALTEMSGQNRRKNVFAVVPV